MKKKFSILLAVLIFVTSFANCAIAYPVIEDDGNTRTITDEEIGETVVYTFDASGDITVPGFYGDDGYAQALSQYNYYARVRLPEMNLHQVYSEEGYDDEESDISESGMRVVWNCKTDGGLSGLKTVLSSDETSKILILSGVLPQAAQDYTFVLTAELEAVSNDTYYGDAVGMKTSFDTELTISVTEDEHILYTSGTSFDENVSPSNDIEVVTTDYKVTVTAPSRANSRGTLRYTQYIQSDDTYKINLPRWLKCTTETTTDTDDNEQIVAAVITFNGDYEDELEYGTRGVVRVPFVDDGEPTMVLGWDVVYTEKEIIPFTISPDITSLYFELKSGDTETKSTTLKYIGLAPVSFDITLPSESFDSSLSVDVTSDDSAKTVTITAASLSTAEDGEHSATLRFEDSEGNVVAKKLIAKLSGFSVIPAPTPTPINPDPESEDEKPAPTTDSEDIQPKPTPESEDVKPVPPASEDIQPKPASGDVNPPASGDVEPKPNPNPAPSTSDDINPPASEDVIPAPAPKPTSGDVPPVPETTPININSFTSSSPETSKLNTNSTAVKNNIAAALGGIEFTDGETIKSPSKIGSSRTSSDISATQLQQIPANSSVLIWPLMTLEAGNVYILGAVNRSDLLKAGFKTGQTINILGDLENTNAIVNGFYAAAPGDTQFMLVDSDGNKTTQLPTDPSKELNVAAYIGTAGDYSTIFVSGTNSSATKSQDVTPTPTSSQDPGTSDAGCDLGIGAATLLILVASLLFRKKWN